VLAQNNFVGYFVPSGLPYCDTDLILSGVFRVGPYQRSYKALAISNIQRKLFRPSGIRGSSKGLSLLKFV
jgi:hypothetical protein